MKTSNIYFIPETPQKSFDLLRWLLFEPFALARFSEKLSEKERISWLLRAYSWIAIFSFCIWLMGVFTTVLFGIPSRFPQFNDSGIFIRLYSLLSYNFADPIRGLAAYLAAGLAANFALGIPFGLSIGLSFSLACGLAGGLAFGLPFYIARSLLAILASILVGSLSSDLVGNLSENLGGGLLLGLFSGISVAIAYSAIFGSVTGLVVGIFWYIGYFRIILYLFYHGKIFFRMTLTNNIYCYDSVVWFPIYPVDMKLVQLAYENPEQASNFVDYLLEYRPFQRNLSMHILHAGTAGKWSQCALTIDIDNWLLPIFLEDFQKLKPSEKWCEEFHNLKLQAIASQQQNQIALKKDSFETFRPVQIKP